MLTFHHRTQGRAALRYTGRVPKGMVCRSTFGSAVAAPTDKRGFVTPKFRELVRQPLMVLDGMGLGYPQGRPLSARTPARLNPCYEHPVHPLRVVAQTVAPLSRSGAKTMIPAAQGRTAPTIQPHQADTIQLHAQAINGLNIALHTLMHGQLDQVQLHRAIGKALRASSAMKRLAHNLRAEG